MNTFQQQASEYIGITAGSTGIDIATTGVLDIKGASINIGTQGALNIEGASVDITSGTGVTTFVDPTPGATGNYIKMGLGSDASFIDFGSEDAGGTGLFDSRIVSFKNVPFSANNFAFITDGNIQLLGPTQIGTPTAPPFKLDYASVDATAGVNQETVITFTAGMAFTAAPVVVCSVETPGDQSGDQFCFVEDVSTTGCTVQYLGTAAAGTKINYIALGV